MLTALTELGIIVPTADPISLRRAIAFGLDNLLNKARALCLHPNIIRKLPYILFRTPWP